MDRKRRGWVWIIAGLVLVPVLYVLSFGPACWLVAECGAGAGILRRCYLPILGNLREEASVLPGPAFDALWWYGSAGIRSGKELWIEMDDHVLLFKR